MKNETDRVILVTGAAGMVGRNITDHLRQSGYTRVLTPPRAELELNDQPNVIEYLRKNEVNTVIHSAGLVGGIVDNVKRPYQFLYYNTLVGLNVVHASIAAGVQRFLNISSSCIYPPNAPQPFGTESLMAGKVEPTNEGYALAKLNTLKAVEIANEEYPELAYRTLLPSNLFGPYDKFDPEVAHMIPSVIARMHEAKTKGIDTIKLWGNPEIRREFMFTPDFAAACGQAVERLEGLPINVNVGLNEDYTVAEYYAAIAEVVGYTGGLEVDPNKPIGMLRKLMDSTPARELLDWEPKVTLSDGIEATYKYYLDHVAVEQ